MNYPFIMNISIIGVVALIAFVWYIVFVPSKWKVIPAIVCGVMYFNIVLLFNIALIGENKPSVQYTALQKDIQECLVKVDVNQTCVPAIVANPKVNKE
jgi:hypothetical protein